MGMSVCKSVYEYVLTYISMYMCIWNVYISLY